jgi:hypothetical protein
VDVSGLDVGHSVHVGEIPLPEGFALRDRSGGGVVAARRRPKRLLRLKLKQQHPKPEADWHPGQTTDRPCHGTLG